MLRNVFLYMIRVAVNLTRAPTEFCMQFLIILEITMFSGPSSFLQLRELIIAELAG